MNSVITSITNRISKRSNNARGAYLKLIDAASNAGRPRNSLSCGNLAHGFAGCPAADKQKIADGDVPNIGIVTAYNDMLSAHKPYEHYPEILREAARAVGATAVVAGSTPAMCDGVTQGQPGMQLSLFSRDVIAQATAISLSHNMFDGALLLGICDKIVPGLLIGALSFGHLPTIFVPGGPMLSGLPNKEKARIRNLFAEGKTTKIQLLKAESESYHSPGTCTFYGTANSNQMFLEIMGLHLPGATFVNPSDPLRNLFTAAAMQRVIEITNSKQQEFQLGRMVNEQAIVNAIVGLLATGGSTNHTIHLVAIAKAAGIEIDWQDFDDLSAAVPLLTRIYPNGEADVNHFRDAGGLAFVIKELLGAGLLHDTVTTCVGKSLSEHYLVEPKLVDGQIQQIAVNDTSSDDSVLRGVAKPHAASGGIKLIQGNLGRGIVKVSAVDPKHRLVRAPALVCNDQQELQEKLKTVDSDVCAVVRFQGISANGMPELHKLTPSLSVLQNRGLQVGLITDGRMSGASGKVPAAIHMSPEATQGGNLALIETGDIIELDCDKGTINVMIDAEGLAKRKPASFPNIDSLGCGRELFASMRNQASTPETGGSIFKGYGS